MGKFHFFRNVAIMTCACLLYHSTWIAYEMGMACNDRIMGSLDEISKDVVVGEPKTMIPAGLDGSTLVSAFYPMKAKHTAAHYRYWMKLFFSLTDQMVVFTSAEGLSTVEAAAEQQNATEHVKVIVLELNQTDTVQMFDLSFWEDQLEKDPEKRIHKSFEVYWVWLAKSEFMRRAVEVNPYKSSFFAWCDIGYFRDKRWVNHKLLKHIPSNLAVDQTLLLDVTFGAEHTKLPKPVRGSFTVGGGFIGGYIPAVFRWNKLFYGLLRERQNEFIGKDQPYMYRACFIEENTCLLVRPSDLKKFGDAWFYMAPYMILGEKKSEGRTWIPSIDRINQPYEEVLEPTNTSW